MTDRRHEILYFADTRFPIERANGAQTMATCQALALRGHQVTLVVRPDTQVPARDPFAFYDLPPDDGVRIRTVAAGGGHRARRVRYMLASLAIARELNGAVVYTRDLGVASFLLQLPSFRRPRVVYESHGIQTVVSAELPALLGSGARPPGPLKLQRLERRERRVWRRARAYVAITRALAEELASRFGSRPHVFVAPDGAAQPRIDGAGSRPRSERPLAAYAGHLYPWKGVDVFVRALALAPGIDGLIVGGHPGEHDRARIADLAASLGVTSRLTITGLLRPNAVAHALSAASMLVLPNTRSAISERYTSPLKLFEYLWLGAPIVASDLTAIREILTDGVTSLLVTPGDPAALAAALERLAADRALADRLGAAARDLAPSYTWAARAERVEAALDAATRA